MATAQIEKASAPTIPTDKPEANLHTLPSSWFLSDSVLELEKRAIFFKCWLFVVHESRLKKAGDYLSYTFAGLQFFIVKNKQGEVHAFHNVCRHRAFPVVRKEQGSSLVLGCKYHGWSYNTNGELTKAPHFDTVEGFEKAENGLFPIRTHVTNQGLVFINFDSTKEGPIPFDEWFVGMENEMNEYDFSDYEYHMSYQLDGKFNWKTLMDGYQECYHCPTTHPGLNTAFKMNTYNVQPKTNYCRHFAQVVRPEPKKITKKVESTDWLGRKTIVEEVVEVEAPKNTGGDTDGMWMYAFPSNGINCYSPAWYSIRVCPVSASHTILMYDIYRKKGTSDEEIKEFVDFLQQVEIEDFDLCEATQKNLNQGIYSTGFLHPQKERGVLYYQNVVKDLVKAHFDKEEKAGHPINPAFVGGDMNDMAKDLDGICKKLECSEKKEVLAW